MIKSLFRPSLLFAMCFSWSTFVVAQDYEASVKWDDKYAVQFLVDGIVQSVKVEKGDIFKKGDSLISLQQDTFIANEKIRTADVKSLQAKFKDAERELNEANTLYEQTVLSDVELQKAKINHQIAKSNLDKGKAELAIARWEKNHSNFIAPWDGFVLDVSVIEGQVVSSENLAQPSLVLVPSDRLLASLWVESSKAKTLRISDVATVKVGGRAYQGKIIKLAANMLNSSHRSDVQVTVRFAIDSSQSEVAGQQAVVSIQ